MWFCGTVMTYGYRRRLRGLCSKPRGRWRQRTASRASTSRPDRQHEGALFARSPLKRRTCLPRARSHDSECDVAAWGLRIRPRQTEPSQRSAASRSAPSLLLVASLIHDVPSCGVSRGANVRGIGVVASEFLQCGLAGGVQVGRPAFSSVHRHACHENHSAASCTY